MVMLSYLLKKVRYEWIILDRPCCEPSMPNLSNHPNDPKLGHGLDPTTNHDSPGFPFTCYMSPDLSCRCSIQVEVHFHAKKTDENKCVDRYSKTDLEHNVPN